MIPANGAASSGPRELFISSDNHGDEPHSLIVMSTESGDWVEELAQRYRELRTATRLKVEGISVDGVEVVDTSSILARLAQARLPQRRGGNFDVSRSDLGEIILHYIGELHGFSYGYVSIRDRELTALPGRGLDQIGVRLVVREDEDPPLVELMLGEAKVSSDKSSPPRVVDYNDDSLSKSHKKQLAEVEKTTNKIWDSYVYCTDPDTQRLFGLAATWFESSHEQLVVKATAVLVRPQSLGLSTDFGSYLAEPEQFDGAHVAFYVVKAHEEDLEAVVDGFIESAQLDGADQS